MPDMLGKKLARRKELGGALPEEKRQAREQETEASPTVFLLIYQYHYSFHVSCLSVHLPSSTTPLGS